MDRVDAPRPLERRLGWTWIVASPRYVLVLLREASSVFITAYLILLVLLLFKAGRPAAEYRAFLDFLWNPGMVVFHVVAAAAALWHTVTWFNLTPKAMDVRIRGWKVPAILIVVPQLGAFAVISGLVIGWVWWVGAL